MALASPLFAAQSTGPGPGWQVAATPFPLTTAQWAFLQQLGPALVAFQQACSTLYRQSLAGQQPAFIHRWLEQGKPAELLQVARQTDALPHVIRPDLLLTETGWAICELDSVPGGMGFTAALNAAYEQAGFSVVQPPGGFALAFWQSLQRQAEGLWAVVYNDESADYRLEWEALARQLQQQTGQVLPVVHVDQLQRLPGNRLGVRLATASQASDAGAISPLAGVYRFYELFTRPDHANSRAVEAAWLAGQLALTPPPRPELEEKLWLALLHHPQLQTAWAQLLPADTLALLQAMVPPGWVMTPEGPYAAGDPLLSLQANKQPISTWEQLGHASQKERQLVLKQSGFSPLAWGSRSLTVGHDVSATVWQQRLAQALDAFEQTPYVLQHYAKPRTVSLAVWNDEGQPMPFEGRVRLCPYYLVNADDEQVTLAGVLATVCPKDKKIIHGMKVATLAPAQVVDTSP